MTVILRSSHKIVGTKLKCTSNFWACEWNPFVWPFKWNLVSCPITWWCFAKQNLELSLFFVYCLVGRKELLFVKTYLIYYFYFVGQPQDARIPVVLHRMWRIGKWLRTLDNTSRSISYDTCGGGGRVLYYFCLFVCPTPKGMVFAPFWSETGIDFAYFGMISGKVFEGMHERICRFNSKWIRKKE